MNELFAGDAIAQTEALQRKEIAPIELVDAAIGRIERLNPPLNAIATPLFESARHAARAATLPAGRFRGVPMLLKDYLCQTAGDPYYEGMRLLRDTKWRSTEDSHLARRLRAAGFVFLGKTNLPELALGHITRSVGFGITRNPCDTSRTAGGSSGGSAAAVAAGMTLVAHANDSAGSLRVPASCCGLVGLKPSRGRVPLGPQSTGGILHNCAEHVLSRSVRDCAAILDCVCGPAPGDIFSLPAPPLPYSSVIERPPGRLRIGMQLSDTLTSALTGRDAPGIHAECALAVTRTAALLQACGHIVEESHPQAFGDPAGLGLRYLRVISASGIAAAIDGWSTRLARTITADDVEPDTWAIAEEGRRYSAVQLHAAYQRLVAAFAKVSHWWEGDFDLLLTPTIAQLPPIVAAHDDAKRLSSASSDIGMFVLPFNFTGQPAISLPLHWTQTGVPVGVQLVARIGREDLLLQTARQLEQAQPWLHRYG